MPAETDAYLQPTAIIDSDHPAIQRKARQLTENQADTTAKLKALFYFVRDEIKYNPYVPKYLPEHFRASNTLAQGKGYCVSKAVLLIALTRAIGTPARLGMAQIRNHLASEKIVNWMGTNIFHWHGYAELFNNGRWVKATPAFDINMCQQLRLTPVEFDGMNNAVFSAYNPDGQPQIEYLKDYGPYPDVPVENIRQMLIDMFGEVDPTPPE
jgi:transglutaminase-like putative cysteine protease